MPLVFSYGSLQERKVQLATFGRPLEGGPDALHGWSLTGAPIADPDLAKALGRTPHANLIIAPNAAVRGMALELTEEELRIADEYERPADYVRRRVQLASGRDAWVYVHSNTAPA